MAVACNVAQLKACTGRSLGRMTLVVTQRETNEIQQADVFVEHATLALASLSVIACHGYAQPAGALKRIEKETEKWLVSCL